MLRMFLSILIGRKYKYYTYQNVYKTSVGRAVVVAQLMARLLPIPEDPGSNPVIDNFYWTYLLLTVCVNDENKEKEAGKVPLTKQE